MRNRYRIAERDQPILRRSFLIKLGLGALGSLAAALKLRESFLSAEQAPLVAADLRAVAPAAEQLSRLHHPTATPTVMPPIPTSSAVFDQAAAANGTAPGASQTTAVPTLPLERPPLVLHDDWASPARTKGFEEHTLEWITLHHEGVYFDGKRESAASYLRKVQLWGIKERGWEDIPYHILIDLEGVAYEGRPLWAKGDTNTSYNLTGHALVTLVGDYDVQVPNQAQLDRIVAWMAWLVREYAIPLDHIHGHKDFIPTNAKGDHIDGNVKITCPGDNLYVYIQNGYFVNEVRSRLGLPPQGN